MAPSVSRQWASRVARVCMAGPFSIVRAAYVGMIRKYPMNQPQPSAAAATIVSLAKGRGRDVRHDSGQSGRPAFPPGRAGDSLGGTGRATSMDIGILQQRRIEAAFAKGVFEE